MTRRVIGRTALHLALASVLAASLDAQNGRRDVGMYVVGDAAVRVTAAAPRVELLVIQQPASLMVYLDGRSVLAWADSAEKLLRLPRDEVPYGSTEIETPILRHPDLSYGNGVMLTRVFRGKRTQCYLYAWVGQNSYTAVPLSEREARSLVAALKRAAAEASR